MSSATWGADDLQQHLQVNQFTLGRRSLGLPTARAPAHNWPGQQGLKISTPTIDRLAQALQSNEVSLAQEAIDDLPGLGAAADKR